MSVLAVMRLSKLKDPSMHPKKIIDVELAELRLGVSIPRPLLALEVAASIQMINDLIQFQY
jgi:hypothetical protein